MIDLSVLIVSFNSSSYIESCISSILTQRSNHSVEVIVVDNKSSDDTLAILSKYQKQIVMIRNDRNLGFAKAMNQAFKLSQGRFIMTFNPDGEFKSDTIECIINRFNASPRAGMVAAAVENTDGVLELPYDKLNLFPDAYSFKGILKVQKTFERKNQPYKVSWVWGSGLTVRREALHDALMFAEDSFLFWEEYDLARKVKYAGFNILVDPSIRVKHHSSTSFKFNAEKLRVASTLSAVHSYRIRKRHFGVALAKLSSFYQLFDFGLLYWRVYISKKLRLTKNPEEAYRMMVKYRAIAFAQYKTLTRGSSFVVEYDIYARNYFNL